MEPSRWGASWLNSTEATAHGVALDEEHAHPDELAMVSKVTDEACDRLGCDDAMKAVIAARVLGFANMGERRYETLLSVALDQTTH